MATKKTAGQQKQAAGGDVLEKAAKAVGATLGAIAKKTGIAQPEEAPAQAKAPKKKIGKLVKKAKSRLPRKQKKQAKKQAARKG